jgi:uncharacterized protein YkwD
MTKHVLLCLAVLAAAFAARAGAPEEASAGGPRADRAERAVIRAVNRTRARHGLARVRRSRSLARAADAHSLEMARGGFFAHESANGS